ncbi:hypothetical protein FISHEDRAFT_75902 [Fistulina hepatica ATCC 64428]|uniref:Uncharacterized protein n=1 Tax=Fistulina hepatica ATCC 64428 TaxID=1128425 RepID=A0A0D7A801_9AGAR|nr:hypothetical protein FISHEDRAFT_75902 [Fistulina hepatica ATCC 64428]
MLQRKSQNPAGRGRGRAYYLGGRLIPLFLYVLLLLVPAGDDDDDVPEPEAKDVDEPVDGDESEQVKMSFWAPVYNENN